MTSNGSGRLPSAYRLPEGERRGRAVGHLPRCLFIEVTNRCNLLCQTCPHTFTASEQPRTLSWQGFLHIVDQFPHMERAVLHGIGEPLLNRELPSMVAHLKARHALVLFNTNATLLSERLGRELIASGLDEIRVSLDAADPNVYARMRGKPLLPAVIDNLTRFTRLQRELGASLPRTSLWITGTRENISELPGLVRLAGRVGIGEVYLQRVVYFLDTERPPGLMDRDLALFGAADNGIQNIIAEAEQVARELEVRLNASGATDPRRSLAAQEGQDSRPWAACLRPWTTAYVTANGNCLPCCIAPFATSDYGSLVMGNLFEQDFAGIWNGERYQDWRSMLLGHSPMVCRGCGVLWSL